MKKKARHHVEGVGAVDKDLKVAGKRIAEEGGSLDTVGMGRKKGRGNIQSSLFTGDILAVVASQSRHMP